jgi:hypothetical protein
MAKPKFRTGVVGASREETKEANMPVLLVPILVGVPVLLGGGFLIYHFVH